MRPSAPAPRDCVAAPDRYGLASIPIDQDAGLETISHDLMAEDELADGAFRTVSAGPWKVVLARVGGVVHALNNRCSHAASSFDGGRVRGATIACPLHGARFDLATGRCAGAAYPAIRTFEASVQDGRIHVAVPVRAPDMSEVPVSIRR